MYGHPRCVCAASAASRAHSSPGSCPFSRHPRRTRHPTDGRARVDGSVDMQSLYGRGRELTGKQNVRRGPRSCASTPPRRRPARAPLKIFAVVDAAVAAEELIHTELEVPFCRRIARRRLTNGLSVGPSSLPTHPRSHRRFVRSRWRGAHNKGGLGAMQEHEVRCEETQTCCLPGARLAR